jgi:flagellar biosynthesis protein FliR
LAWARCLPLFWLTPSLAFGVTPGFSGAALALGMACALAPLYAATGPLPAAAPELWLAAGSELLRGALIAVGLALPALVLRTSGAIAEGLFGWRAGAAEGSKLGRLCGLAALVVAVSADGLRGALSLLLSEAVRLPARLDAGAVRALLWPTAELLLRAFTLGVSLCGALFLGSALAALVLGILGRLSPGARPDGLGAALWPGLGLSLLCLTVSRWLLAVPELARGFARDAARLLSGLP